MKIVYLHQYFNTPRMSGGTRSYEMARRMVAAGHDVEMVTSYRQKSDMNNDWFITDEAGIKVHWSPVPYSNSMSYLGRIKAFVHFALGARRKVVELEGDLVFATSTPLTISIPAVFASEKKRIPMVFEVRDLWPEMPIAVGALRNPILKYVAKKLEGWAYRHSSAVVALSPGMKEGVAKSGFPESRIAVIPNSSDNAEFSHDADAARSFRHERDWLGERPLVVYTGTFGKVNGVGYMVDLAYSMLKLAPDVRFLLVGDGAERDSVVERAGKLGVLENNLYFEKRIAKRDIPALLSAATIATSLFIDLPEMRANSANKFFDALASGTPVLLNYGGWMHELVQAHGCGMAAWRVPISEVAEQLAIRLYDQQWLEAAGSSARALAESEFDRDLLAGRLIKVLENVASGDPESASEVAPGNYSLRSN